MTGALPVIYPFLVSNPGEAAQAKRRIAGITIGHLPPPLVETGLSGAALELERLVDEYSIADGLDRRRRERLARLIVDNAQRSGLSREAGVASDLNPDEALRRIDAWLCDLKDLAIKDGLHVYGRAGADAADPAWAASARCEREALLAALDGKRVAAGAGRLAADAAAATCCRPGAICSPPTRACCRRRRRWSLAGWARTKSFAFISRPTARCRARS